MFKKEDNTKDCVFETTRLKSENVSFEYFQYNFTEVGHKLGGLSILLHPMRIHCMIYVYFSYFNDLGCVVA